MLMHRNRGWLALALTSLVVLLGACAQLNPAAIPWPVGQLPDTRQPETTTMLAAATPEAVSPKPVATTEARELATRARPAAVAPVALADRSTVAVRRGPIAQMLQATGRVAGLREVPLAFSMRGIVETVAVQPGQQVEAGEVLVELDGKDTEKALATARGLAELAQIRLSQGQARIDALAQARQRDAARRDEANRLRVEKAVADAQEQLRRAVVDYERLKAGPSPGDRLAAEWAVAQAVATLERAQVELAHLKAGPTQVERRVAEQQVAAAQLVLRRAEAQQARLARGPEPATVRAAQQEVAQAEADVARLASGVDKNLGELERARRQEAAGLALATAQDKLEAVRKGPDQLALDDAWVTVENARGDLANAQARLQQLAAGPPADQVSLATTAVNSARLGLMAAEVRLDDLKGQPRPDDLADAEARVAVAKAALDRAPQDALLGLADGGADQTQREPDTSEFDLLLLRKAVEEQEAQVKLLTQQMETTRIRAPFAGWVASVAVRAGDQVESRRAALVLASSGNPIVAINLLDRDAAHVAIGQPARVQIADRADPQVTGQVVSFAESPSGPGRIVQLEVAWPGDPPAFGTAVQVNLTVQQKEDALLVPQRAIHSTGARRYVENLDGATVRIVDVSVGIVSGNDAEILSGVHEGQLVVVGT